MILFFTAAIFFIYIEPNVLSSLWVAPIFCIFHIILYEHHNFLDDDHMPFLEIDSRRMGIFQVYFHITINAWSLLQLPESYHNTHI